MNSEKKMHKNGVGICRGHQKVPKSQTHRQRTSRRRGRQASEEKRMSEMKDGRRGEAANSVARQAGVEEGIWTELWSRSLPVRLTQQQPCHRPNPPNHPSTTGAETSKDWRGGLCRESDDGRRKEKRAEGRKRGRVESWKDERMD